MYYAAGQLISTLIVLMYFEKGLNYSIAKLGPSLIVTSISCAFNCYYIEFKEKKEFLEMKQTEIL